MEKHNEKIGMLKRTWLEIDLDAMRKNYESIREFCGGSKIMAVIKADAYGHGAERSAELFEELSAEYLAVSNIEEALQLRRNGISSAILILGYTPPEFTGELIEQNLTQTVFDTESLEMYDEMAEKAGKKLKVHIKIDTGMSRLGFSSDNEDETVAEISGLMNREWISFEGIFTHFAMADNPKSPYTDEQFERFCRILKKLNEAGIDFSMKHAANSSASLNFPATRLDIIRPGLILYGVYPGSQTIPDLGLEAAMRFCSSVSQVRRIKKGTPVGYDCAFVADRDMEIAVIPIGYADGLLRRESRGAWFEIKGNRVSIVGNICMDMCMVDVTGVVVSKGDRVTVFGSGKDGEMTINEAAKIAGTIPYELCCMVSKRVSRIYYQGGKQTGVRSYII